MFFLAALLACTAGKSTDTGSSDDTASDPSAVDDTGTSNDTGTTHEALTPEAFVSAVVPLECALMEACVGFADDPDSDFTTYDECVAFVTTQLTAHMETCASFDAAAATACIEAQETATCTDTTAGDGSHFAACTEVCSPAPSR